MYRAVYLPRRPPIPIEHATRFRWSTSPRLNSAIPKRWNTTHSRSIEEETHTDSTSSAESKRRKEVEKLPLAGVRVLDLTRVLAGVRVSSLHLMPLLSFPTCCCLNGIGERNSC